jgi:hypothetical protein
MNESAFATKIDTKSAHDHGNDGPGASYQLANARAVLFSMILSAFAI